MPKKYLFTFVGNENKKGNKYDAYFLYKRGIKSSVHEVRIFLPSLNSLIC
jgi:hypothetical protein